MLYVILWLSAIFFTAQIIAREVAWRRRVRSFDLFVATTLGGLGEIAPNTITSAKIAGGSVTDARPS